MTKNNIYSFIPVLLLVIGMTIGCQQEQALSQKDNNIALQLKDSTEHYIFEVQFPEVIRSNDLLRTELQGYAQSHRTDFISFFKQDSIPRGPIYPWQLSLDFAVYDSTEQFISILGQGYSFTGGAHGNHFYKTVNYDNSGERLIQLTDLFPDSTALQPISEYSRKAVVKELQEKMSGANNSPDTDPQLSMSSMDWIREGTQPDFTLYQNFVLTHPKNGHSTGLTFLFPPYQVAAYVAGSFEIFVPESVFKDQLTPKGRKLF